MNLNVIGLLLIARVAKRLGIVQRIGPTLAFGVNMVEREHHARIRIQIQVPLTLVVAGLRTLHRKVRARFPAVRTNRAVRTKNTHAQTGHAAADGGAFHGHAFLLGIHGSENRADRKCGVTLVGHAEIVL